MSVARDNLSRAQQRRRARVQRSEEDRVEAMFEACGLSEADTRRDNFAIDPSERNQLKGIIARLRKLPHPFSTCMRDLRKHKPEWTEDRRKRTCQSLKVAAGRTSGKSGLSEAGVCVLITDGMATMLERLDLKKVAEFYGEEKS